MKHHVHLVGGNVSQGFGMEHFVARALHAEDVLGTATSYRAMTQNRSSLRICNLKADILLVLKGEVLDPLAIYSAPRYSVYWYQDDVLSKDDSKNDIWRLGWAFDKVYSFDKHAMQAYSAFGVRNVGWLPLAADPEVHCPVEAKEKVYDIGFVGQPFEKRINLFNKLLKRYKKHFFGVSYKDYAKIVAHTKVNLNVGMGDSGTQQRVFEVLAMGGFLITNNLADDEKLFEDGVHLKYFDNVEHLCELIDYYLVHNEEREKIAKQGREFVLAKHTYRHRVRKILEDAETWLNR